VEKGKRKVVKSIEHDLRKIVLGRNKVQSVRLKPSPIKRGSKLDEFVNTVVFQYSGRRKKRNGISWLLNEKLLIPYREGQWAYRGVAAEVIYALLNLIFKEIALPLNFEMGNTPEILEMALRLKPDFVCLVPETREEVTTEGGLDVVGLYESLKPTVSQLQEAGIKVSMFIDPDLEQVEASEKIGAEMIELHTGCFANADEAQRSEETQRLISAAKCGNALGLQVNAGHGINLQNLAELLTVPHLTELNIGHTLVARSVSVGLKSAIIEMREAMKGYAL